MIYQNKNESGRSMVEMLGVLAVIGVLSVGGVMGYRHALNQKRVNDALLFMDFLEGALTTYYAHYETDVYEGAATLGEIDSIKQAKKRVCDTGMMSDSYCRNETAVPVCTDQNVLKDRSERFQPSADNRLLIDIFGNNRIRFSYENSNNPLDESFIRAIVSRPYATPVFFQLPGLTGYQWYDAQGYTCQPQEEDGVKVSCKRTGTDAQALQKYIPVFYRSYADQKKCPYFYVFGVGHE